MNAVELALHQALEADPSNWDLRFGLLDSLSARGATDEAVGLIQTAPSVPDD